MRKDERLKGKQFWTEVCNITPEIATAMLEHNKLNRDIRNDKVRAYVSLMKEGKWDFNGESIIFDEYGNVLDGQHRLWAIVYSECTIKILCVGGVDAEARYNIDTGLPRSVFDAVRMSGDKDSAKKTVAIALRMADRFNLGGVDNAQGKDIFEQYRKAAEFVTGRFKAHFTRHAVAKIPVMTACARAYYTVGEAKLAEFIDLLCTGMFIKDRPGHATVHQWREHLMSENATGGGQRLSRSLFKKTERVIKAFADGETITRFYEPEAELFPIPGE